ncbi:MAG TPA: sensor histidine kinase [Bacilli bacterium]
MAVEKLKWFEMNNLPIRYKLIIHFLLISILPSLGLAVLINWTVDQIIEKQVNENTLQIIGKVNGTLESYASNMQNISYFIAFDPGVKRFLLGGEENREDDHYEIRKFLQGFTTLYSEIAGILVVNNRGAYISNEMYARYPSNLTEETWYRAAVEGKGIFKIIGHPRGRNVTTHVNYKDDEVISVVRAILDPDTQNVLGVVLIDLKLRVIAETVKDVRLGKSGYLAVIDEYGENIYSPARPIIAKLPKEWFRDGNSGTFSKRVDGKKLQFIYRKSAFTNWTTVGVFSTNDSTMEVREIRFYVVSFVFFVCLVGIAASFYLSYSISRPIGQLMSFMRKAEQGDLAIRYRGDRMDEVGMLGQSFNKMLMQINKLISHAELQERQKREAELRSLQAHIKPHFLYNTLDTIQWMARKKGAEDVAEVVESLSRLFRIGLSKGNDMIPLEEEFAHIHSYLTIQKVRYREKLQYTLNMAPETRRLSVLKVILQPLVENAIYHGIKERRGPGHVWVEAGVSGGRLILRVGDDGAGIPEDRLKALRQSLQAVFPADDGKAMKHALSGYGIINVQARLKLTFGDAFGIHIDSEAGQGTTVTITHPIIADARPEQNEQG